MATPLARVLRFGTFELDVQNGELRKSGLAVRIQEQPRQVLLALLERPGQVVAREELCRRLWADGTFVDFEHSLNTAVKKLRDALGDAAENPRFIETVPLRGYRFMAPVENLGNDRHPGKAPAWSRRRTWFVAIPAATVVVAAIALAWTSRTPPVPTVVGSAQLTHSGRVLAPDHREFFPGLATDGARIFFSEVSGSAARLAQVSAAGGEVLPITLPFEGGQVLHASPDGSKLLVRKRSILSEEEGPLWVVPALGGAPHRVDGVLAHAAAWSPDGQRMVYAQGEDLFLTEDDGSASRKLVTAPGRAVWLRWSPDGMRLRFTLVDSHTNARSLWEVSAEGRDLHPLLPREAERGDECCGEWTADGRYFLFRGYADGRADVWVVREGDDVLRRGSREPTRLTTGPLQFGPAIPSRDGRRIFAVGGQPRIEVLRYDLRTRDFQPYSPDLPGAHFTFSGDGQWGAYVERRGQESTLWRSRVDGSQRLQLTRPPLWVMVPRWSPDGKRIAFMARTPGKPWKIYLVPVEGGRPEHVLKEDRNQADPTWSRDGQSLMFGRPPDYFAEPNAAKAIHVVDLRTKQVSMLPGSEGLFSPRWSPDGRFVAAMPLDQTRLMLFDFTSRQWSELAPRHRPDDKAPQPFGANLPVWSRDGQLLYFQNVSEEGSPIYRIRLSNRGLERIADLGGVKRRVLSCLFTSLALDGSPIVSCQQADSDIYALDWRAR